MRAHLVLAVLCATVFTFGCYPSISGKVIDAETKQPIEGAIVLVEWTKKHGIGDRWTESYKVVEVVSDKDGNVKIEGCYSPFVEPPDVTVYKKGYVAWSSRNIFPSNEARKDFKWGSGYVFKTEHFRKEYSYDKHVSFVNNLILSGPLEKKKCMLEAIRWEEEKAFEERRLKK